MRAAAIACKCGGRIRAGACDRCGETGERPSACKRGYDRQWRKWREWVIKFVPGMQTCRRCELMGKVTPARELHHKTKLRERPDMRTDLENIEPLCTACHTRATRQGE